ARERDMVLLGPNGNGFINAADGVAPYGLPITPPLQAGPLGIVLQSGGLASVVLHMATSRNIGVSRLVATGNEAMVTATGVLAYHARPLGRRLAAVTASGGACDIIADRATDEGIVLPAFPEATAAGLAEVLPAFSNPRNPLDVTGYVVVDSTISHRALEV